MLSNPQIHCIFWMLSFMIANMFLLLSFLFYIASQALASPGRTRFRRLICAYVKYMNAIPFILFYKTTLELFTLQSHISFNGHMMNMIQVHSWVTLEDTMSLDVGKRWDAAQMHATQKLYSHNHSNSYGQYLLGIHKQHMFTQWSGKKIICTYSVIGETLAYIKKCT